MSNEAKPWYWRLYEYLLGEATERALAGLGAAPGSVIGTISVPIETTFYTAPQPPPGLSESRDLAHCHPEFQRRMTLVLETAKTRYGREFFITRTWSSAAAQFEHYKKGRHLEPSIGKWVPNDPVTRAGIVTNLDGYEKRSRHGVWPAEAADVCVDSDPGPGKHADWQPEAYVILGQLADEFGLIWGGRFKGFGKHGDYPHLELPGDAA